MSVSGLFHFFALIHDATLLNITVTHQQGDQSSAGLNLDQLVQMQKVSKPSKKSIYLLDLAILSYPKPIPPEEQGVRGR